MKVHLVDGSFEVFRCFYGAPRHENKAGQEIGATRGFLYTMSSLLREDDVTHIVVVFDPVVNTEKLDAVGETDLLTSQIPLCQRACRALGIRMWPIIRYQADDGIATGAARYKQDDRVEQVVICSSDNDFAQCVDGNRVVLRNRIQKKIYEEADILEKFGVTPQSIPDYLALVGDKSDGIPGLPAWGKKSTATVLSRYLHIENIPKDLADWDVKPRGAARLSESLEYLRDEALLHRDLSILITDVPIRDQVDDLRWEAPNADELKLMASLVEDESVNDLPDRKKSKTNG